MPELRYLINLLRALYLVAAARSAAGLGRCNLRLQDEVIVFDTQITRGWCFMQVDNRHQKEPVITSEQAKQLCDRNFGIGGDGVSILTLVQIILPS